MISPSHSRSGTCDGAAASRTAARAPQTESLSHPSDSATACPAAQAAAKKADGLTDDDIADAYGASGLYGAGDLGTGQHIALYELEPFSRSDVQDLRHAATSVPGRHRPMLKRLRVDPHRRRPARPARAAAKSIMDIEDISAMAPGADIDVYEGPQPRHERRRRRPGRPATSPWSTPTRTRSSAAVGAFASRPSNKANQVCRKPRTYFLSRLPPKVSRSSAQLETTAPTTATQTKPRLRSQGRTLCRSTTPEVSLMWSLSVVRRSTSGDRSHPSSESGTTAPRAAAVAVASPSRGRCPPGSRKRPSRG